MATDRRRCSTRLVPPQGPTQYGRWLRVLGRVCKLEPAGYTRRYETKRTYKHAMEAAPTAASASKTSNGTTCFGPSTHHQRHLVDSTYRCPMAGFAQALWLLEHRGQPLLSLAKSRYLATSL